MQREPVALIGAIAIVLVSLAATFNVALETSTIETLIVNVIIAISAISARSKVTPV